MSKTAAKIATVAILSGVLAIGLAACGGDYTPADDTHTGSLADGASEHGGRTCDTYDIQLGRGWNVTADMTSEWDNYLYLTKGSEEIASNDDTNGFNAQINQNVEMAGGYTVHACAYSDGRGDYTLHVVTAEGSN